MEKYIFIFAIGLVLGLCLGKVVGELLQEQESVKHGVGEYYLDTNSQKQFRWKVK